MIKFAVPKSGKRATHVWDGTDTLCTMYSTGGLKRFDKYEIVDNAESHPNHRRICVMCNNRYQVQCLDDAHLECLRQAGLWQ